MNNTTLHIPMDKVIRDSLEAKAKKLGFDSAQAYIRVWAKAEAEGRVLSFGDEWGEPSETAAKRINRGANEARSGINVSKPFHTVNDMMNHLDKQ